ncbi:MAG TPA: TetR/AcrR family transcriptional regulator [Iamia sp.]|nr:TetR/AcrR family transcriptional regulator [Iamia sp.]
MAEPSDDAASRREQRRQRHQHFSREQFLDAAEEIFGRKGYHETTLKEVAEQAEFSVGSVYSFFENKEDLFRQIFLRRGGQFMPEIRAVLDDVGDDPLKGLHQLVDFEAQWFRRHPHFGRLYLRHSSATFLPTEGTQDPVLTANHRESMALQSELFRRGQEAGVLRDGDPEVLARVFSGIMSAFQALDPVVMSDDPSVGERMTLDELHDLVEAAFRRPEPSDG